jgi:hypothetical protein
MIWIYVEGGCRVMIRGTSRDSSVGIATRWTARVRLAAEAKDLTLRSAQTGSGAHPAFYPMATRALFAGGKAVGV